MAAYAALVSLLNTIDNIQNHPRIPISLDKKQVESLCYKIDFLLKFIETVSDGVLKSGGAQDLVKQIASAAYAAEDVIESHIVDHIPADQSTTEGRHEQLIQEMHPVKETSSICFCGLKNVIEDIIRKVIMKVKEETILEDLVENSSSISLLDLHTVIQDINSVMEKVVKEQRRARRSKDVRQATYRSSSVSTSATPHHHHLTTKSTAKMVGFDDKLFWLLDQLTGQQSALQIIPIVGMGGIGKTTLATTVYEHPLITYTFHVRSWVTISQQYNVREILSKLLSCESGETADESELGERLHKSLIGRRYLIILDDLWSLDAWYKIKSFFPKNPNASRILVTTRLSDMAARLGTSWVTLKVLDEAKSWELFCEKAFEQVQCCPPVLEEIGKKIAKKCQGLPLSITVIGALLSKSSSMKYWENMSREMKSILNCGGTSLDILSLSYGHLPAHLKPCFLYMGVFPEDREIRVSRLIQLWVSEGFVKPSRTQSLEEIAEGYLKDLIDRNLILVGRWSRLDGKMETCQMHDLLRDLCLKTAEGEKFMCVVRLGYEILRGVDERRFVLHETIPQTIRDELRWHHGLASVSRARSLVSIESLPIKYKLLRVLHIYDNSCQWEEIMKQVNLRYVCIAHMPMDGKDSYRILSSISRLWNLQTLIISHHWQPIHAPTKIWEMLQLRYVDIYDLYLPSPPNRIGDRQDNDQLVLRNLQTLKKVSVSGLNRELLKRIPNLVELEIKHTGLHEHFPNDFGLLRRLESLKLQCFIIESSQKFTLPSSLQKLTLESCKLDWGQLTEIGALPNLEVLRLHLNSARGSEWSPVDGQFLRLKFLEIKGCGGLIKWNAESSHFPALEKLVLQRLWYLNEIPSGIGEIAMLGLIDLIGCTHSAAISAMEILMEQESLGNEDLRLRIMFYTEDGVKMFKEKKVVQQLLEEGFTNTTRLQIICKSNDGI